MGGTRDIGLAAAVAAAALAPATGCVIETDYSTTSFQCELEPVCPEGQECVDGRCVPIGGGGDPTAVRRPLTFDLSGIDEDLVEAPVLVALDSSRVDYAAAGTDGADIRFFDADGTTLLPHEIERWDPAGRSLVWVLVPQIDAGSTTDSIWLRYGPGAVPIPADPPATVWVAEHVSVWHLAQAPAPGLTGAIVDSAPTGINGTPTPGMSADQLVEGQIGSGIAIGSDDAVVMDDRAEMELPVYTWELWINADAAPVLGAGNANVLYNADGQFNFSWDHNNDIFLQAATHSDGAQFVPAKIATPLVGGTWYYVAGTYDGQDLRVYLNGALEATATILPPVVTAGPFAIGNDPAGPRFAGQLDEVRVSRVARSDAWLAAQYRSMTDELITFGPEQPAP